MRVGATYPTDSTLYDAASEDVETARLFRLIPTLKAWRVFRTPTQALPAWTSPAMQAIPGGVSIVLSSKHAATIDALPAYVAGMPPGREALWYSYWHECDNWKSPTDTRGDLDPDTYYARWQRLLDLAAAMPQEQRARVLLGPIYTDYAMTHDPNWATRWERVCALPGVDFIGIDTYNIGYDRLRTPEEMFGPALALARRYGLPLVVAEWGQDDRGDPAATAAMIRRHYEYLTAQPDVPVACWFYNHENRLDDRPDSLAELQRIAEEASMARVKTLGGYPIEQHSSPNIGGAMTGHKGLVLHIAEGSYEGTISWQMNPDQRYASGGTVTTSSTFIVGREPGEWAQMVDSDRIAWCQRSGSYDWLSIELAGYAPNPPTAWQIEACAQLLAWAHQRYGVPLQATSSTSTPGLGHHSMDNDTTVEWGHDSCPGSGVINAKSAIVARAKAIAAGDTQEDDMPLTDAEKDDIALRTMRAVLGATLGKSTTTVAQVLQGVNATIAREGTSPTELAAALAGLPQPVVDVPALAAALAAALPPDTAGAVDVDQLAAAVAADLAARLAQ